MCQRPLYSVTFSILLYIKYEARNNDTIVVEQGIPTF